VIWLTVERDLPPEARRRDFGFSQPASRAIELAEVKKVQ